ncbi:MAG: endonuclease III [Spirochaetes bacterium]|uniref:Endonuclease III n=1 Tax=Candidatus Ornithospirochaeta stercoripullorum TaxID=2840899 RepID=A0A9D9H641_9SPIO|nr:endonuclease III [Candidatus Ornithospirochaeta stercoripullorum]
MLDEKYIENIFESFTLALAKAGAPLPSVSQIAEKDNNPYRVLVSTLISLRTKDEVTLASSLRLFAIAPDLKSLSELDEETIAETIKPAGFYKRKAVQLKNIAKIILQEHDGIVPNDMDTLLSLPGVGIKTASLVLNLGYGIDAICVDCHVHEIVNRLGWVNTKTPEETEKELRKILPKRFWISLNELLVRYGQKICTPVSPFCSLCPESGRCPKNGVQRMR